MGVVLRAQGFWAPSMPLPMTPCSHQQVTRAACASVSPFIQTGHAILIWLLFLGIKCMPGAPFQCIGRELSLDTISLVCSLPEDVIEIACPYLPPWVWSQGTGGRKEMISRRHSGPQAPQAGMIYAFAMGREAVWALSLFSCGPQGLAPLFLAKNYHKSCSAGESSAHSVAGCLDKS